MKYLNPVVAFTLILPLLMGMSSYSADELAHDAMPDVAGPQADKHHETGFTIKPHAGIQMQYSGIKSLQPGESRQLHIQFSLVQPVEQLEIIIRYPTALDIGAKTRWLFHGVDRAQLTLPLTILGAGVQNIEIDALLRKQGSVQSRSFVIPVTAGEEPVEKVQESHETSSESSGYILRPQQGVISMPATEHN